MLFGVTGHRDVEQEPGELLQFARLSLARMVCSTTAPIEGVITGMARGWDLAVAEACDEFGIPFWAALPFWNQAKRWRPADRALWDRLITRAAHVEIGGTLEMVSAYLKRDRWIVDQCDELWALNSGRRSGTDSTCLYAQNVERKIVSLWPDWLDFRRSNHDAGQVLR